MHMYITHVHVYVYVYIYMYTRQPSYIYTGVRRTPSQFVRGVRTMPPQTVPRKEYAESNMALLAFTLRERFAVKPAGLQM